MVLANPTSIASLRTSATGSLTLTTRHCVTGPLSPLMFCSLFSGVTCEIKVLSGIKHQPHVISQSLGERTTMYQISIEAFGAAYIPYKKVCRRTVLRGSNTRKILEW
jgi:hypothetical protein